MFTAYAELEARLGLRPSAAASPARRPTPSASMVSKGDTVEDALLQVRCEGRGFDIVCRESQVVCVRSLIAEEEVGGVGDPMSGQRCTWQFDRLGADGDRPGDAAVEQSRRGFCSASSRTRCSSITDPTNAAP